MKVLLILPPMMQMNSPFPSTAYLTSFLRSRGYQTEQRDLCLDLFLRLFSSEGLREIYKELGQKKLKDLHPLVSFFLEAHEDYALSIDAVVKFLQGKDSSLALRIAARTLLPEGPRFVHLDENPALLEAFGEMGLQDRAKYLASQYIDDLADVIKHGIDPDFEFARYAENLASSQRSFDSLYQKLKAKTSLIDQMMFEILDRYMTEVGPDVVGFSTPFPGNVYAALKSAQYLKRETPSIKTVMGGGFVNTEMRDLSDGRFFEFIDYLVYDDGERPFECLLEHLAGKRSIDDLFRTRFLKNGGVVLGKVSNEKDVAFKSLEAPTFSGLPIGDYISMMEVPNPMSRMWTDFRWNKMVLAHGCYWKRCSFCDVSLDYIGRYEPASAERIYKNLETIVAETGQTGFHFVDEAAPPALLKQLAELIVKRGLKISWWGNLRYDKQFTPELAELMAESGCVAVTGGLEVASPRLLEFMKKGVTIEQVAQVTKSFKDVGIYVHAYLMYGFPTQTTQETVDSLEVVRQLFANGCLDSAYWHRFVATVHSPIGKDPEAYGIKFVPMDVPKEGIFATYSWPYVDPTPIDNEMLGVGLKKALYNYMHGIGLDEDVSAWFEDDVPAAKVKKSFIRSALNAKP